MVIDHTKDLKFGQNSAPGSGATNGAENKSNFFWRPNYPTVNANYPAGGGANVTVRDINNGRPFQRIRPNTRYIMDVPLRTELQIPGMKVLSKQYGFQTALKCQSEDQPALLLQEVTLINGIDTAIWMADQVVTPARESSIQRNHF